MRSMPRYLALVVGISLMLSAAPTTTMAQDAVLPDLIVQSLSLSPSNKIQVTVANVGKGPLPLLWSSTADVYQDGARKGTIYLAEAPSNSSGGGIGYPGGTSTFLTAWSAILPATVTVVVDPLKNIIESNEQNNSLSVRFAATATSLPDLTVQTVDIEMGNKLTIAVANIGQAPLPAGWQAVASVHIDETAMGSIKLNDIPASSYGGGLVNPGGISVFLTEWEVLEPMTVAVTVDTLSQITETNENNNTATVRLVPGTRLPDLVLRFAGAGAGNKLSVTVANCGNANLPLGWTAMAEVSINQVKMGRIRLNDPPVSSTTGGIGLPGGTSTFVTAWDIAVPATVTIVVDALNNVTELDEQNNTATIAVAPQPEPTKPRLPDLKVSGITTIDGGRLAILVMNAGDAPLPKASAGTANVFVAGERIGFFDLGYASESFFGGIGTPGGFSSYLLDYRVTGEPNVLVAVDATNSIAEANEQNNSLTRRLQHLSQSQDPTPGQRRSASYQIGNTSYILDGSRGTMDVAPVILEDRTFMPVRFVAEPLGGTVLWDEEHRRVTVTLGLKCIDLWINSNVARINGTPIPVDPGNPRVASFIFESRTYLPLRFVSEVLGGIVTWEAGSKTIELEFESSPYSGSIWKSTDISGNVVIDDGAVWEHFCGNLVEISGRICTMKDGRRIEMTGIRTDPEYAPRQVVDPDQPG